ncbi:fimbrial protein [Hafnia sp.]|uniref:fimbrial protein n=1 Tax=Hafnia sp. TaxID=1873498 RepID=UPI002FCC25F9
MKKLAIATLVMGIMASGTALANTGSVQFIGSVSDTTCNISPEINGVQTNTIELKNMLSTDVNGVEVAFKLVPDTKACLDKTSAVVGWQSSGFNSMGLVNMKGSATGASIKLVAVNAKAANTPITGNMQNIEFGNGTDAIGAFEFKAQMSRTDAAVAPTAGSVISSAAYAVAYK